MMRRKYKKNLKKSFQNIFLPLFLGLLFFIITVFLIVSNWKMSKKRTELEDRILKIQQEIEVLEERNEQLKAGVAETLESDYAEKVLREKGLYKKKGENVVVILPLEEGEGEEKEEEKNIWEKILGKLRLRD